MRCEAEHCEGKGTHSLKELLRRRMGALPEPWSHFARHGSPGMTRLVSHTSTKGGTRLAGEPAPLSAVSSVVARRAKADQSQAKSLAPTGWHKSGQPFLRQYSTRPALRISVLNRSVLRNEGGVGHQRYSSGR